MNHLTTLINIAEKRKYRSETALLDFTEQEKTDRELIIQAIATNGYDYINLPDKYKDDEQILLLALITCSTALNHASDRLRNDRSIAMLAITYHGDAYKYLPDIYKNDYDFVWRAASSYPIVLKNVPRHLVTNELINHIFSNECSNRRDCYHLYELLKDDVLSDWLTFANLYTLFNSEIFSDITCEIECSTIYLYEKIKMRLEVRSAINERIKQYNLYYFNGQPNYDSALSSLASEESIYKMSFHSDIFFRN